MKVQIAGLILVTGGAVTAILAYVAVRAMLLGNGHSRLHWDHYGEGWPEVVLLILVALAYPWAIWQFMKKSL